ncbi:uncharacterized protein LOC132738505 [Ruditapes philippinarum]|uniref:uncharacterized protein LOC132738505 n=1 Tax=Ruditapes philippinarum TaxID=129788 RepID=UPI00295BBAAD|nr:uncharacterized protein LOC132738505 [Ruditapes philippinarum]
MPSTLYRLKEHSNEDKQHYKLFNEMTEIVPQVARQLDNEKQLVEYKGDITFVPSKDIVHQVKNDKYIGTISTHRRLSPDSTIYAQYERTLQMKPSFDKEQCHILGMILISNKQMIVAGYNNNKIKIIDICHGRLVSQISVSSEPRDVIKLPQNQVAVALPDEQHIQIMSYTYTSMSLDRRIDVGNKCYCVAYWQDMLVVGCNFNPGKLIVLDFDGNIVEVFDTPGLFGGPKKIVISIDEKFIYVSDYNNVSKRSKFLKIDWQGNIVQRFEDQGYVSPTGIQELIGGTLLVCYRNIHTIVRLSRSFKECPIVGLEKANLHFLQAVIYCKRDQKLYISCSSAHGFCADKIKIFSFELF